MKRTLQLSVAVGGVCAAVMALASPAGAAPPPSPTPGLSAQAMAVSAADSFVAAKSPALLASAGERFVQRGVTSSSGLQFVSYERTFQGLPVVGGDFVVVTDGVGAVRDVSVAQDRAIGSLSTSPKITSAKATEIARGQLVQVDSASAPVLSVYAIDGAPRLVWDTRVTGSDGKEFSNQSVYVDALTGAVLGTQEHVMHGDGNTAWNGPKPVHIDTTHSGTTFTLRDPAHPTEQCQDAANNRTFSGTDDLWGNGNATNRETGCADAMFDIQTENRMLSQWLGRNSFDGNGGGWPIRVGLNDLNAFYDGTQVQIGHNQQNQWISSLDVVAHEHGHGIDDHTPGGISRRGTQEFVADVFGASTEWFANEPAQFDGPDFLVGEKINLVGQGPIRNMFNPAALGDPNCWSTAIPGTEVHAAAGPGNHWYYLLSQGTNPTNGQPTSTTCNGTSITGIGVQTAFTIFYNAMLMKTTGFSYLRYRTATLNAAKNLTPGNCANFNVVKAAWDAVSVPAQAADPTCNNGNAPVPNNPGNQTGTVGTAVSLQLSATGGTPPYTWTATGLPAGLSISASGLISGTPTTPGTSSVTATVRDSANPAQTGTTTFNWTINPVGGGCSSPGNKLGNPGFEVGSAPWTATANVIGAFAGQTAHSGTRFAWMDGYGTNHTDTLQQSVTIPAGCRASLTFWLHIDTAEGPGTAFDRLTVQMGTTTVATFSNLNSAAGYQLRTFDVSAFAGQTVVLKFTGTEDVSLQTSFVVDDTAVTAS